jgi:hypothetical protein
LQNPAPLPVTGLFESQDTIADQLAQNSRTHVPSEPVLLNDQDVFDQLGVVDEIGVLMK